MPALLNDITIYYWGLKQRDTSGNWQFGRVGNFICDFYHRLLLGYKPPKTSRICIHINEEKNFEKPGYNGSICAIAKSFNEDTFLHLSNLDKYKFLLDLVHNCCTELAEDFAWRKEPFDNSYAEVKKRGFSFLIDYPVKQSKDKKKKAHVQIYKTENTSAINLIFSFEGQRKQVKLFEKKNWFWIDSVYEMAENSKWLDTSTFGVYAKRSGKFGYYSLADDVIIGKLDFKESDF